MDNEITAVSGANDAELRSWLIEVCPVVARALDLPKPMQKAADQFFKVVPVATALRWVEMLGMGKPDDIRLMVKNSPQAAVALDSRQGLQAIKDWEETHGAVPVMKALERAAGNVPLSWSREGSSPRAVIRSLAAISVSHLAPNGGGFREELAGIAGSPSSDAAALIDSYASAATAGDGDKIDGVDRFISGSLPFGPWVRSLWIRLRLRYRAARRGLEDNLKSHPFWRLSLTLREIAGG